jgi:hypothetical protein
LRRIELGFVAITTRWFIVNVLPCAAVSGIWVWVCVVPTGAIGVLRGQPLARDVVFASVGWAVSSSIGFVFDKRRLPEERPQFGHAVRPLGWNTRGWRHRGTASKEVI